MGRVHLLLGLLIAGAGLLPVSAEVSIESHFARINDYRFDKVSEISTTEGRSEIGSLPADVLDDYILFSHSTWIARPTPPSQDGELRLEIFEMKDLLGAFGVFSIWENSAANGPHQRLKLQVDHRLGDDSLTFWRGNYVFRVTSSTQGETPRESLLRLAKTLVEVIPLLNVHPITVIHLPREGLLRESIRYYLGESSFELNPHFPKAMVSELGFESDAEVAFARYDPPGGQLFLVGYPTVALAAHYYVQLQNAMQSYFSAEGVYMKRSGVIISIFFGPERDAQDILSRVQYTPTIKWIYEKEFDPEEARRRDTASFLRVVARSLLLAIIFFAITVGGGLAGGLIRFEAFRRFPTLNRRAGMVILNLNKK